MTDLDTWTQKDEERQQPTGLASPPRANGAPALAALHESEAAGAERYSRQVLFSGIGPQGQARLASAHIALVGCGATGAAAASLLARSGVGRLTLIDRDFVETSNLQRQVLFDEQDAREALPKAEAARRKIALFNSDTAIQAQVADLVPGNIHTLLSGAALVLDATDNYQTRYLINDYAIEQGIPWIYAGAVGAYAVSMSILPGETACLACLFPEAPIGLVETCDTAGILNTAVNLAASIEVTEALKYLVGARAAMRRTLISHDLWTNERSEVSSRLPRAGCSVCQGRDFRHLRGESRPYITLCGRNSVQIHEHGRPVEFAALAAKLAHHGSVRYNSLTLRFTRGAHTITVFADGRAVVQGTSDTSVARSLYARFLGA